MDGINKITEEQAQSISDQIDDMYKDKLDIEIPEEPEEGEKRIINATVNPETGETQITNTDEIEQVSFEDVVNNFNANFDIESPVTEEELSKELKDENTLLNEIAKDNDLNLSSEDIKVILEVTNRRINKEDFNVYRALPESVQKLIDDYIGSDSSLKMVDKRSINTIKNSIASNIVDQFQQDINIDRVKYDFANELTKIYSEGSKEIAESSINLIDERNKAYREAAEKIEDQEKKEKLLAILDQIDAARELTELKEFAKTCKIKRIELEKPHQRIFKEFSNKYKDSAHNIYDINMCGSIVVRNIPELTQLEIASFFIAFCKQVRNYDISDPLKHAYIYYVLYYCAMLDGDKSDKFKNNIKEVVNNIKERNKNLF